ncbi:MAG: T9SS type A sorting domain-containing protein [Bacteroidia bacterium]|nr:T9SS type A sorting domain-containing protein [Bacteroidia bacterium]
MISKKISSIGLTFKYYCMKRIVLALFCALFTKTVLLFGQNPNLMKIINGKFNENGNIFYPVSVNYIVKMVEDDVGNICVSPYHEYGPDTSDYDFTTKAQLFAQMVSHFQYISSVGFNSIRVVGLVFNKSSPYTNAAEIKIDRPSCLPSCSYIHTISGANIPSRFNIFFDCIQQVLDAASIAGIKVQLLVGGKGIEDGSFSNTFFVPYLEQLSYHFRNNSTLYSYDLVNEPSYPDFKDSENHVIPNITQTKDAACGLVNWWYNAIRNNSGHLVTIGLTDDWQVWDPAFMHVDFLSYHVYPNNSNQIFPWQKAIDRVKVEIKRFSLSHIPIPWMIGETGFAWSSLPPGDPNQVDDGSLGSGNFEQSQYAKQTLEMVRDCGGIGYSWWVYQDASWDYNFGLLDHANNPKQLLINEFMQFNSNVNLGSCVASPGLTNPNNILQTCAITGQLFDQNNNPISGGKIIAYDSNDQIINYSYSENNGFFVIAVNPNISKMKFFAPGCDVTSNLNPLFFCTPSSIMTVVLQRHFGPVSTININNTNYYSINHFSQAYNSINMSNVNVSAGANVIIKAGNSITLQSPMIVDHTSSFFRAYIGPYAASCSDVSPESTNQDRVLTNYSNGGVDSIQKVEKDLYGSFDFENKSQIIIYPNPTEDIININSNVNDNLISLKVIDLLGSELKAIEFNGSTTLDVSELKPSVYILEIENKHGQMVRKKLIKE